ncbi:MAG TPA: hypothetical protein VM689_01040 [Aliidongia sp.]|nr:hypothetical protein [Aliidongia sp.]
MSVASASSAFPVTGSLGLSLLSIVGGSGTASANAAAIAAPLDSSSASGPFAVLSANASTTTSSPTIAALTTGQLTNGEHKIIQAIGQSAGGQATLPWNADGSEPSQLSSLRSLGWLKLDKPIPGDKGTASGVYELTPVGQAIFKRTVGGDIGVPPPADSSANGGQLANISSAFSQGVSAVAGLLSSVGVDVSV